MFRQASPTPPRTPTSPLLTMREVVRWLGRYAGNGNTPPTPTPVTPLSEVRLVDTPPVSTYSSTTHGAMRNPNFVPATHGSHDFKTKISTHELRSHKSFPTAFTFVSFIAFGPPLVLSLWLSKEPSVQYWIGNASIFPIVVPLLLCICHVLHLKGVKGGGVLVLGTVLPCVLFIYIGLTHKHTAEDVANRLLSTDCTTFEHKRKLETAWRSAQEAYLNCLGDTPRDLGLSLEDSVRMFRLHNCKQYNKGNLTEQTDYRDEWKYLRYLEEQQACSGWCQSGPRLWTYVTPHDSCSVAAGTVMQLKVVTVAGHLITYTWLAFFIIFCFYLYLPL